MYAGHFAVGLALHAARPRAPALPLMLGAGVLDIVDGTLVAAGIERVTPNPAAGPYLYFDLTFIDWDHSLLMAAVLSLAWGALFLKRREVAVLAAIAAFSHFLTDWPMHNGDLALYPHSERHFGLGLWGRLGTGAWLLEGAFAAALAVWAWRARARDGVSLTRPCVLLAVLFLALSPWTSPMKFVATLDPPIASVVLGFLVATGFLIPGFLFVRLLERGKPRPP